MMKRTMILAALLCSLLAGCKHGGTSTHPLVQAHVETQRRDLAPIVKNNHGWNVPPIRGYALDAHRVANSRVGPLPVARLGDAEIGGYATPGAVRVAVAGDVINPSVVRHEVVHCIMFANGWTDGGVNHPVQYSYLAPGTWPTIPAWFQGIGEVFRVVDPISVFGVEQPEGGQE